MATPSPLPPAVPAKLRMLESRAGRIGCYAAGSREAAVPLLLIHSVNAAASAAEMRPLFEHYRRVRPVYALDLPGYGSSDRCERDYTPRLMTDAVLAVAEEIHRTHAGGAIDAIALSLSCEFLARAAVESPDAFRTLGLVSPTGFSGAKLRNGPPGSTRGMEWLYRALRFAPWDRALFAGLTVRPVVRYFLERTWGAKAIDEGLLDYDVATTRQPGARFAPYCFLSGKLFSDDIRCVYEALRQPVWMTHGVRGDFVDYRQQRDFEHRANWRIDVLQTGALPHFEALDEFIGRYEAALASLGPRV